MLCRYDIVGGMKPSHDEILQAIEIARKAGENSFNFISGNSIGACIIASDGKMFGGCIVENDISGLGVCAERSAIFHAVVEGYYTFKAIVVANHEMIFPCGACLQNLTLFSLITDEPIYVISATFDGNYEIHELSELLPKGYKTNHNLDAIKSFKKHST